LSRIGKKSELKYKHPFNSFLGVGIASPDIPADATKLISYEGSSTQMSKEHVHNYFKEYKTDLETAILSILTNEENYINKIRAVYDILKEPQTFFSLTRRGHIVIYLDYSGLDYAIDTIVMALFTWVCQHATNDNSIPENYYQKIKSAARRRLGDPLYFGEWVMDIIMCVAALKYKESRFSNQKMHLRLPNDFAVDNVHDLKQEHKIEDISYLVKQVAKTIYLPIHVAIQCMEFKGKDMVDISDTEKELVTLWLFHVICESDSSDAISGLRNLHDPNSSLENRIQRLSITSVAYFEDIVINMSK
jgi:hypothetical protein